MSEVHRDVTRRVDELGRLYEQLGEHDKLDQARFAEIRDRLTRIDVAMFGDGNGRKGVVELVENLADITRVGKTTFRVFMWFGGAVIAVATAIVQFKAAVTGLIH